MTNPSGMAREFMERGRAPTPIIDAHTHMGAVYGTSLSKKSAAEMIEVMDARGVCAAICAPHSALFDPGAMNGELEEAMRRYPGRFYGYFTFNPNYDAAFMARIGDTLTVPGYVGLKFLPGYHRYALDGPAYARALDFADEHGLIVLSHTGGGDPYNGAENAARVLKRHPRLTLILGHSAPGECEAAMELARKYDNVYLDLCDTHRVNGAVQRFVNAAGAERVLFGTDMPWYDPAYCFGSVLFARVPDEAKELILYKNAKRLIEKAAGRA